MSVSRGVSWEGYVRAVEDDEDEAEGGERARDGSESERCLAGWGSGRSGSSAGSRRAGSRRSDMGLGAMVRRGAGEVGRVRDDGASGQVRQGRMGRRAAELHPQDENDRAGHPGRGLAPRTTALFRLSSWIVT